MDVRGAAKRWSGFVTAAQVESCWTVAKEDMVYGSIPVNSRQYYSMKNPVSIIEY